MWLILFLILYTFSFMMTSNMSFEIFNIETHIIALFITFLLYGVVWFLLLVLNGFTPPNVYALMTIAFFFDIYVLAAKYFE